MPPRPCSRRPSYYSPDTVAVPSPCIAICYKLSILLLLTYVIGYMVVYQKGYQATDIAIGNITAKLKGVGEVGGAGGGEPFDAVDAVWPPGQSNAMFITTGVVDTLAQRQDTCAVPGATCAVDGDCAALQTGINPHCVKQQCLVQGWCPQPAGSPVFLPISYVQNFTLFIRVDIEFPLFNIRRTTAESNGIVYGYNTFTVSDIVRRAGYTSFSTAATNGTVISLDVTWNCNLDTSAYTCEPVISFTPLYQTVTISSCQYPSDTSRNLRQRTGIYLVFNVSGVGGKFDMVTLMITLASGMAFLALSVIGCDLVAVFCLPKSAIVAKNKYADVDSEEYKFNEYEKEIQRRQDKLAKQDQLFYGYYRNVYHDEKRTNMGTNFTA